MRRCALPAPLDLEQIPLKDNVKRYLCGALRLREGDHFIGFDGEGYERVFKLARGGSIDSLIAIGIGESYEGRGGAPIGLCFALPKGDKLDLVARQITELGISSLYLWSAERSVGVWKSSKVDTKLARLSRVVSEAARQSGRADQLRVVAPLSLQEIIEQLDHIPIKLVLDPLAADGWPSLDILDETSTGERDVNALECVLVVGPEGGLSPTELTALGESGWRGVRLNSPILRTETAGVVACAIALDRLGYLA